MLARWNLLGLLFLHAWQVTVRHVGHYYSPLLLVCWFGLAVFAFLQ